MLYNKAIEYYSALNDEKHLEYLQKLQKMFQDEKIQKLMEAKESNSLIEEDKKEGTEEVKMNGVSIQNEEECSQEENSSLD